MKNNGMIKDNFYLTKTEYEALKHLGNITGMSMAEHIRRAIDTYLETERIQTLLESVSIKYNESS